MPPPPATLRAQARLDNQLRIFTAKSTVASNSSSLSISDITLPLHPPPIPPGRYPAPLPAPLLSDQFTLAHLRWLSQKTLLGQDVCLLAPAASCPYTRRLALGFCALARREYEYVAVHADLSEADLKQARELSVGSDRQDAQLKFVDSSTVRAVKLGRVLILDGIHKAERGILPLLNNLLENREMNLEDGTHIVHPDRYEKGSLPPHFIPASRAFMVICIGVPVPPFTGQTLDPSFRSRFQVRFIDPLGASLALATPFPDHKIFNKFKEVVQAIQLANDSRPSALSYGPPTLPNFPVPALARLKSLLSIFNVDEDLSAAEIGRIVKFLHFQLLYLPQRAIELLSAHLEAAGFGRADFSIEGQVPSSGSGLLGYKLTDLLRIGPTQALAKFSSPHRTIECSVRCGSHALASLTQAFNGILVTPRFLHHFNLLCQSHALDTDIALIPLPGVGKGSCSTGVLVDAFAKVFGYAEMREKVHLYREMSARELVLRKVENGGYALSRIVEGAVSGALVQLSGVELVGAGMGLIAELLDGRALELWGGRRLVERQDDPEESSSVVGQGFRVVCRSVSRNGAEWSINHELENMVVVIGSIGMSISEEKQLMCRTGLDPSLLSKLECFVKSYRALGGSGGKSLLRLGTRGWWRICCRLKKFQVESYELASWLRRRLLVEFLPKTEKMDFEACMESAGIGKAHEWDYKPPEISDNRKTLIFPSAQTLSLDAQDRALKLEEVKIEREVLGPNDERAGLVPEVEWFFENRDQNGLIRNIAIDILVMNQHLVLLGNQGVGKNKVVDRALMLLGKPREYIQLHRDSTVQQLMFQTTVIDGKIIHLDSPLLRAVKHGRVLVVDEADKAPEHVTGVLKSLAEEGEMSLADGRKIVGKKSAETDIEMDERFRMILLANRPGFPFLGNQFLQVLGDGFGCYAIGNPDLDSELQLVGQLLDGKKDAGGEGGVWGGSVGERRVVVRRLVGVFDRLRQAFEEGSIGYPFSLRELLSLVRHLKMFPQDGLEVGMRNVFDFDIYRPETIEVVHEAMLANGFKVGKLGVERIRELEEIQGARLNKARSVDGDQEVNKKEGVFESTKEAGGWEVGKDGDLGENSWGGGTGMTDFSGTRVRVGPRKILRRTNLYQMPDQSTNIIPDHVRERAKALTREELAKKLQDLAMRAGEMTQYGYYYKPVQVHIRQLAATLEKLEARQEERVWVKGQSDGEFDERKLVDGLIGESAIYKRRYTQPPEPGRQQSKPKRVRFVFDISSSIYRFQADGRLDRSCQTAIMIMEAFGMLRLPERYVWDMVGHAGDSPEIELVVGGSASVRSIAERWKVVEKMKTFSQYAIVGDHTVEAIEKAVDKVAEMDSDEAFVIAISDANFDRYGITPEILKGAMNRNKRVKTALIGIGEGSEAAWLPKVLPRQAYQVKESREIPIVLKSILSSWLN